VSSWAYLLRCADGTLYAGWTSNLDRRLAAHNAGTGAKYTRGRRPVALAWARACADKGEALRLELELKRMTRAQKEALIAKGRWG
jgi:putative endonuclease